MPRNTVADSDGEEGAAGYERPVNSVAFADESTVYTAGDTGVLRWDLETGTYDRVLEVQAVDRNDVGVLELGSDLCLAQKAKVCGLVTAQLGRHHLVSHLAVQVGRNHPPAVGDEVYGVSRLDQGFDHAPMCSKLRVIGQVSKPRSMWALNSSGSEANCLPAAPIRWIS